MTDPAPLEESVPLAKASTAELVAIWNEINSELLDRLAKEVGPTQMFVLVQRVKKVSDWFEKHTPRGGP